MVAARRAFLDAGWYAPIAKTLADLVRRFCPEAASVLDAGCGEGYYLSQLGWVPERWGIDISRDAVRYAAVRDRSAHWLTATAAHLPFADGGFDCGRNLPACCGRAASLCRCWRGRTICRG